MKIATSRDDISTEIDGVWVEYGDGELLIARMGNPKNRRAYERAQARYKSKARKGTLTADERVEITARTLADSILLDWKGINDMEGKPLDYSHEIAYQALRWDIDLRIFVSNEADVAENFRSQEVEENAGKSRRGSTGKGSTATK